MKAPFRLETARLLLRRPEPEDARAILDRYAGDPEVTRYLGWPRHRSLDDTLSFLRFSEQEWERWPAGPYLICARAGSPDARLLGSTGLSFEQPDLAMTGYVLARDAWGQGYATEALTAMVALAGSLGVQRLFALCHPDHRPSYRVLEKCGFARDASWSGQTGFPNLGPGGLEDTLRFELLTGPAATAS